MINSITIESLYDTIDKSKDDLAILGLEFDKVIVIIDYKKQKSCKCNYIFDFADFISTFINENNLALNLRDIYTLKFKQQCVDNIDSNTIITTYMYEKPEESFILRVDVYLKPII